MSHVYVIEIGEEAVGLVVRQSEVDGGRSYCFYAVNNLCRAIEGKLFQTPDKAKKEAATLLGISRRDLREPIMRH